MNINKIQSHISLNKDNGTLLYCLKQENVVLLLTQFLYNLRGPKITGNGMVNKISPFSKLGGYMERLMINIVSVQLYGAQ